MATKICDMCGREFDAGKGNVRTCPECHVVRCEVCGKEMELHGAKFTKYRQRGWVTCSSKCGAEMTRRGLLEREGISNVSQRQNVREKLRETRRNDSDETKAKRAAALKKSCSSDETKAKRRETNRAKHGYEYPIQNPENAGKASDAAIEWRRDVNGGLCIERVTAALESGEIRLEDGLHKAADVVGMSYSAMAALNQKHDLGFHLHESRMEQVVAEFLDSLGVPYVRNIRSVIAPYELDFYMPEHNVAIEVNDFATHNIDLNPFGGEPKSKKYHWEKTRMCDERGIRLIHAWQHCLPTWEGDSGRMGSWPVLQNVITHALGMTPHRHYARQMRVVEFPAIQTKKFFDENNINGYRNANVTYALVPKDIECPTPDDIVMAYAVGRAYFGKGKYDAEIARGACLLGHNVVGGASKLWRYIIDNTDYQSIVYYTDRNFYQSNSLGFLENVEYVTHQDSFWNYWADEDRLANREPMRHAEIMRKRKSGEVWQVNNAGTDVFVWRR